MLVAMGSQAYGVAKENSDTDVYGFAIPHKDMMFPHLKGEIFGFGTQTQRFEVWQEHRVYDNPEFDNLCQKLNVKNSTTLTEIEEEMKKRGLI